MGDVDIIQLNKDFEFQNNIKAENVDIEKNIAVAYNNVLVSDEKSIMRANTISLEVINLVESL